LLIIFTLLLIGFTFFISGVLSWPHSHITPLVTVFLGHATFLHLRCFCLPLLLQAEKLVKDIVSVEDLLFGYGKGLIEGAMGMARVIQQSIDNCRHHCLRG